MGFLVDANNKRGEEYLKNSINQKHLYNFTVVLILFEGQIRRALKIFYIRSKRPMPYEQQQKKALLN